MLIKGILKADRSVQEDEDEVIEDLVEFDFYINSKPIVTTLEEFVDSYDEIKVVCVLNENIIFLIDIEIIYNLRNLR